MDQGQHLTARQMGEQTANRWLLAGTLPLRALRRTVRDDLAALGAVCRRLEQAPPEQQARPAVRWLLENWYLARRAGAQAERALRGRHRLRALREQGRVLRLEQAGRALAGLACFEEREIAAFLSGIQDVEPLEEEELAALPQAIVAGLLTDLRRTAEELEALTVCREHTSRDWEGEFRELFARLRRLQAAHLGPWLEELSVVDRLFRLDPAGVYPEMDADSRRGYRTALCRLARRAHRSQAACAQQVLDLARQGSGERAHIGWYLFREPLGRPERAQRGDWYLSLLALVTTGLSVWAGFALGQWWAILLFLLPLSEIWKNAMDFLLLRLVPPRPIFRMELRHGVPPEGKTLCVIVSLLSDRAAADDLIARLERYYLTNRRAGSQVEYGILADLPDRPHPMTEEDRALLEEACDGVETLNRRYSGAFHLLFREPEYRPGEGCYQGRERKRGAIGELVRLLRGAPTTLQSVAGDAERLRGVRFLLVLDRDTVLTVNAVTRMAGAMLHPLNAPHVDRARRIVTRGYGILQPRVEPELGSAGATRFARLFGAQGGLDPYGSAASDLYHDLFDRASFLGKGLIHVEAFGVCLDGRLPEGRVLSHDLLEGAYLRTGYLSRVELMDSCPSNAVSWLDRYHRWIRGDWQLLPWLGRWVRGPAGERERNPLCRMDRWKLLDNLRRSLVPPATLLALLLGICLGGPLFTAAALTALASAASNLLYSMAELLYRRGKGSFRRYRSGLYAGLSGAALRTAVQILFLPVQSATALGALWTALWRMTVSHRRLLNWVTSDQSNGAAKGSFAACLRRFWPSVTAGLLSLVLARHPTGALLGLLWLLSPVLFWKLGRPTDRLASLSQKDRAFLLHEAALIWRYFDQWLRPEFHYLIPDNVQALPDKGAAPRTSPTNLGLALLACLAALDLRLTPCPRALELIARQLETMETLPRWHGHLYNWYDIRTARPLQPEYISTVDSGNLCACLIALSAGLRTLGEEGLAGRAARLAEEMDFSALYDGGRGLFYVGYDLVRRQYQPNHYDLMASEARLASYLAVARGEVPAQHWRQLSRALVRQGRYTGMASWTGTMFEYLMPQLFLPCYEDSLLYESLCFCLSQQRRRGRMAGVPWGISESAYYALDAQQNYQYKAHGVASLGLHRGLDRELVISPYSSFLALLVEPGTAAANLRRLRALGAEGKYGLYEALDFTDARGGAPHRPLIVPSWMAHHLGMSLLAVDNCLGQQPAARRFFDEPAMRAHQELLQEKVPVGASVLRPEREIPPRTQPRREERRPWRRVGRGLDAEAPIWGILSNGGYAVFFSAGGAGQSVCGESTVLHPEGVQIAVERGGGRETVFPRPAAGHALRWRYGPGSASLTWRGEGYLLTEEVLVDRLHAGELRTVTLRADVPFEGRLCLLLRPVLAPWESYAAHPAFSRLCVESHYLGCGVRFSRCPGRGGPAPTLTALWEDESLAWTTNRERYLACGSIRHAPREGTVIDPCLALEQTLSLSAGQTVTLRLALAAGDREESRLTAQGLLALRRHNPANLAQSLARRLSLSGGEITAAFCLLARLLSPGSLGQEGRVEGQESLWPLGISGDLPLAVLFVSGEETGQALRLAALHTFLRRLGFAFDLALLLPEAGDYRQTLRRGLTEGLQTLGAEGQLGARGGIHLLSEPRDRWEPVLGMATLILRPGERLRQREDCPGTDAPQMESRPPAGPLAWHWGEASFQLETGGGLPVLRWSHILTNGALGWRCDEAGTGHLWYQNAQMGQITPWQNDPTAVSGPEDLLCRWAEGEVSLFARRDGYPVTVTYGPGYASWEKRFAGRHITLTASIPPDGCTRWFHIQAEGTAPGDRLIWRFAPKLAHRDSHRHWVRAHGCPGGLMLENPAGTLSGNTLFLFASREPEGWSMRRGVLELRCALETELTLTAGMERPGAVSAARAEALREETERWWLRWTASLTVHTLEPALDHYLSFWGRYQTLAGRMLARSGLYQCGGAYGFRDQLQDALALLPFDRETVRAHLRRAARHQFREGDVMHWWHPALAGGAARGVRTRISDDLLWLPYALGRWVEETGDLSLLSETEPYLQGRPLEDGEEERYEACPPTGERDSLYRHAVQAIECVLNRGVGEHGLCRMGAGDWNDGMNRLGIRGRGESVWLTWFLSWTLRLFGPLCAQMGETDRSKRYAALADRLAAEAGRAWDGGWYLRAYDDDGRPVGSHRCDECAIDSLSQSFAVLAPGPDPALARRAVCAAADRLYDRRLQLARLLDPPFHGQSDPGYIRSYPPGVRENGGQYTHAACWLALALLKAGERETGAELLLDLLPERHSSEIYRAEPYVLAGDVYTAPGQEGRGGWSWYTGAAGWFCQTATRSLLGLRLCGGALVCRPNLPNCWPGYTACWRGEHFTLEIEVTRGEEPALTMDGAPWEGGVPLEGLRGRHVLRCVLPPAAKNGGTTAEKDV